MTGIYERLFANRLALPPADEPLDKSLLPARGGVYALTDEDGRLIQTLGTQSLRRSVAARLQEPGQERATASRRRADLRSVARTIWWQPAFSVFETSYIFLNVARKLLGQDYHKQLAFSPVWFARLEPDARLPRWTADRLAFGEGVTAAGPFTTRKNCARFIQLLEDLFDLCRHHGILEQAPSGQACAYFEMGRCPAPCNGSIALEAYRETLRASASFATGDGRELLDRFNADMAKAAAELQFERAEQLREKIACATAALSIPGRLTRSPRDFRYLVIQAGAHASTVRPFFVKGGRIEVGDDVHRKVIDEAADAWSKRMSASDKAAQASDVYAAECISLVGHFLAKGDRATGLYLGEPRCEDAVVIADSVRAKFVRLCPDNKSV